jgi:putative PIN family toxin of toxin-antitoxin system
MTQARPRVIYDCNILFQGFISRDGPAYRCLRLVEQKRAALVLSLDILAETRDVLGRPFVREVIPEIGADRIEKFLKKLRYTAELWRSVPQVQKYPRDPDDEPYLNLAIAARAEFLVSRDNDLLTLSTDHSDEAKQFRQLTRNQLRILGPAEFLAEMDKRNQ